jgi:sulfatase maturation enzyme AslB (radical SAM superfamily)
MISATQEIKTFTPAKAYWNQKEVLRSMGERIHALSDAVDNKTDLWPFQLAQLMAAALEFKPEVIIELGRGKGNSTAGFTEVANHLREQGERCEVVSLCISEDWERETMWKVLDVVDEKWFDPLRAIRGNILTFDYNEILKGAKRCLVFWDAHGFDVAECVLGRILPKIKDMENLIIMHDLSDARYIPPEASSYNEQRLWRGNDWSGPRVRLGFIDSSVEQAVAIVDFTSRNKIAFDSADHSFDIEISGDPVKMKDMEDVLGDLFNLGAHWFWFTMNDAREPLTFPDFKCQVTNEFYEISIAEQISILDISLIDEVKSRPELIAVINRINHYIRAGKGNLALKMIERDLGHSSISLEILQKIKRYFNALQLAQIHEKDIDGKVAEFSKDELESFFKIDPYFLNFIMNKWEYVTGQSEMTTYPWNIYLPISDSCNAKCVFCSAWIDGKKYLPIESLDNLAPVLKNARRLGLAGYGEPLKHPEFDSLVLKLTDTIDKRCEVYLITNGFILDKYIEKLTPIVKTFNISLNASTAETHNDVMRLGKNGFDRIIDAIKRLIFIRDFHENHIEVNISMVVINQNIHEVESFIELGNKLKVNNIYLRTLTGISTSREGLNYHLLPPYLNPEFDQYREDAKNAINKSSVNVYGDPETWSTKILTQELVDKVNDNPPEVVSVEDALAKRNEGDNKKNGGCRLTKGEECTSFCSDENREENVYNRKPRFFCKAPYENFYLNQISENGYLKMTPCCYMADVPGHEKIYFDGTSDFFEVWNSPAMKKVRATLKEGPLLGPCKSCPHYDL